ncbi:uncharacterized protein UV8b_05028 [Ustilaginoidea virens]|uniref:Uncharacterized protein n=1 Tax=Ustilaginoidea virens TaxID=1159556 RepID=A0A8E5HSP6_USTVR|nr:uncharacterized protein UV8b_05028 [Ustilaginoidea virens]QUC20787.1 hypothetical protein UV8b_05028 [Ustilaginoidea virens]
MCGFRIERGQATPRIRLHEIDGAVDSSGNSRIRLEDARYPRIRIKPGQIANQSVAVLVTI